MQTIQTVWAVVPMLAPGSGGDDDPPAERAGKAVVTGVSFIITFFVLFPLVFAVHVLSSKK
jgi:hypothetical protein